MTSLQLSPLTTIPRALIQAVDADGGYWATTTTLLCHVAELDAVFHDVIRAVDQGSHTRYDLDISLLERPYAYSIFRQILSLRNSIHAEYPLLKQVADLTHHLAHCTVNIMPRTEKQPKSLASYTHGKHRIEHYQLSGNTYELALAHYLGVSPAPLFGLTFPYDNADISANLARFGFGVFTYLYVALYPECVETGTLPRSIIFPGKYRPVSPVPIDQDDNGVHIRVSTDAIHATQADEADRHCDSDHPTIIDNS